MLCCHFCLSQVIFKNFFFDPLVVQECCSIWGWSFGHHLFGSWWEHAAWSALFLLEDSRTWAQPFTPPPIMTGAFSNNLAHLPHAPSQSSDFLRVCEERVIGESHFYVFLVPKYKKAISLPPSTPQCYLQGNHSIRTQGFRDKVFSCEELESFQGKDMV